MKTLLSRWIPALLLACTTLPAHAGAAKLLLEAIESVARSSARFWDDAAAGAGKAGASTHGSPVAGGLDIAPGQIAHAASAVARYCTPRRENEAAETFESRCTREVSEQMQQCVRDRTGGRVSAATARRLCELH